MPMSSLSTGLVLQKNKTKQWIRHSITVTIGFACMYASGAHFSMAGEFERERILVWLGKHMSVF